MWREECGRKITGLVECYHILSILLQTVLYSVVNLASATCSGIGVTLCYIHTPTPPPLKKHNQSHKNKQANKNWCWRTEIALHYHNLCVNLCVHLCISLESEIHVWMVSFMQLHGSIDFRLWRNCWFSSICTRWLHRLQTGLVAMQFVLFEEFLIATLWCSIRCLIYKENIILSRKLQKNC